MGALVGLSRGADTLLAGTVGALRAWAGDGGVLAMAAALLDVAGYGDAAAVVEDPTSR